jgi:hypothetical protein
MGILFKKAFLLLFALSFFVEFAQARRRVRTLIVKKGDTFEAGMASDFKSIAPQKLQLTLNNKAQVVRGKKLTAKIAKDNIEAKLGKKLGAVVKIIAPNIVIITYKGKKSKLLKALSRMRIRPDAGIKIAASKVVSDTGMRAKIAARAPRSGEAKVKLIKYENEQHHLFVIELPRQKPPAGLVANKVTLFKGLDPEVVKEIRGSFIIKVARDDQNRFIATIPPE